LRRPAGLGQNGYVTSDTRKKVYVSFNANYFTGFQKTVRGHNLGASIVFQPLNALNIIISTNYSYNWRRQDQFVTNLVYNGGTRTIVSSVDQKTLRFTGRVNYNITPDLTIQYYGQPYITRPLYTAFAYVSSPLAKEYDDRFVALSPSQIRMENGTYIVDEDLDGTDDYSFRKPDFNFVQFRSNLVVRWEYRRGSELYLVWAQGNTATGATGELDDPIFGNLFDNAFASGGRNSFLLKWTYRFVR
jgi:hypothetical protein